VEGLKIMFIYITGQEEMLLLQTVITIDYYVKIKNFHKIILFIHLNKCVTN